ncbi:MAG: hypothetical protein WAZ98_05180 [Cyclobacteriaceae bacterium]
MKNSILVFLLTISTTVYCQEEEGEKRKTHYRMTVMMANAHIPSATEVDGDIPVRIVPTWGLSYDYWLSNKWAIGLHNELFLQQFKIEKSGTDQTVERSYPVSVSVVGIFKPTKRLAFLAGVGKEFEKHKNFSLICLETEYGFELPDNWELNLNLIFESKIHAYDAWTFGVGFSKFF